MFDLDQTPFFICFNQKIMDTKKTQEAIKILSADQPPIFGKMTPQHMLEHLIITLKISSGRINLPKFEPTEISKKQKKALLKTKMLFPKDILAPGSNGELIPLKLTNLEDAKQAFIIALEQFGQYHILNPTVKPVHPRFGPLTHQEWCIFHEKHIAHHFSQFALLY